MYENRPDFVFLNFPVSHVVFYDKTRDIFHLRTGGDKRVPDYLIRTSDYLFFIIARQEKQIGYEFVNN